MFVNNTTYLDRFFNFSSRVRHSVESGVKSVVSGAIKYIFSIATEFLHKRYDGTNVRDSDVVVVLTATKDHNGAMSLPKPIVNMKLLCQKDVTIIYKRVSTIQEINSAVK